MQPARGDTPFCREWERAPFGAPRSAPRPLVVDLSRFAVGGSAPAAASKASPKPPSPFSFTAVHSHQRAALDATERMARQQVLAEEAAMRLADFTAHKPFFDAAAAQLQADRDVLAEKAAMVAAREAMERSAGASRRGRSVSPGKPTSSPSRVRSAAKR